MEGRHLSRQPGDDINIRSGPQMREYQTIARRIARDGRFPVLDWGCGWGQITSMLVDYGVEVTALEHRADEREEGFHPMDRHPTLRVYRTPDPVRLPFPTASFGSVLSCGVLEHVVDPHGSLDEIRRVLQPDGFFYVFKIPNRYSYVERIAKVLKIYYHGAWPNDRVYTKRSIVDLLEGHGFAVRESRRANMLPLTLDGKWATQMSDLIWILNRLLSRVPVLNLVSTNLELVAAAPR